MTSQPDHTQLKAGGGRRPATELHILRSLGVSEAAIRTASASAQANSTTLAEELIRLKVLRSQIWWQAVARELGLRYFPDLYLPLHPLDAALPDARFFQRVRQAWHQKSSAPIYVFAPLGQEIEALAADLAHDPAIGRRIGIAAPETIRRALRLACEPAMTHQAIDLLRVRSPAMSAADGRALTRRMLACLTIMAILAFTVPMATLAAFNLLFLIAGGFRLAAALDLPAAQTGTPLADHDLPSYAVLIPLYREAGVVADVVAAMRRLDYPADRLSLYLIVEADDRETLVAAQAAVDGDAITVIAVPPSSPRTKPKALVWAMPFVDADLVTVYDAEDRPEPDQLRQAAAVFAAATPDLVCLQAVLDIDHAASSSPWLSRQFALEYRVLFRAILPWLAEKQLFLPLGGTSNHFRREALLRIGCWDPFNVTEDVDIAVRIHRAGLSIGTIGSVTHEEAPLTWSAWHWQRTRWMKGWLQTWLVHMRRPVKFYRDLGLADFATFQVLILGQILSALAYPFGAVLIAADIAGIVPLFADRSFFSDVVLAFQLLAMGCGWLGAAAALAATAGKGGRMVRAADILSVPVYWFLLFGAAIHAIAELIVDPHRWNKTGHGFAERTDEIARDDGPLKSSDSRARPHP